MNSININMINKQNNQLSYMLNDLICEMTILKISIKN